MLYIGIDLGTSAVKLLLMESGGKIEKIVSKEYPLSFPHPGWSEQIRARLPEFPLADRCMDWLFWMRMIR